MTSSNTYKKNSLNILIIIFLCAPALLNARGGNIRPLTPGVAKQGLNAPIPTTLKGSTAALANAQPITTDTVPVKKTWWQKTATLLTANHKTYTDMPFGELKKAREKEKKNLDTFIKYTERLIALCDDIDEQATLSLELAKALFTTEKYERAGTQFTQFSKYYLGHADAEYALFQAILCAQKRILSFDRDQTKTLEAIELADAFLDRNVFTTYRTQVLEIKAACYKRLIESELNVCSFYLQTNRFNAIEQRMTTIRTDMLTHAPEMKEVLIAFEQKTKTEQENFKTAHLKLIEKQTADAAKKYEKLAKKNSKKSKITNTTALI